MDLLFSPPYVCVELQRSKEMIYLRKARSLLRYASKNGRPADVVAVMRAYRERVGALRGLDVRLLFKAFKAVLYSLQN